LDQHPALSWEGGSVEVEVSRLQVRDANIVSPWFQAYRSVLDFVEACLTMLGSQKIGGDRETACIERGESSVCSTVSVPNAGRASAFAEET
jgi:hypothetical protein